MTRLAQVKAERDEAKREAWTQHMALLLSLTSKPDHVERFKMAGDAHSQYRVSAYGLSRADGGYVVIRRSYPGQRDDITAFRFEDWRRMDFSYLVEFGITAERIGITQNRLLRASA